MPLKPVLWRKRPVTLIAGMLCLDGILLASDREESGGERKDSVPKIAEWYDSRCSLAIAGAGHGPLCDVAIESIARAAKKAGESLFGDHEMVISEALRDLHNKYIWQTNSQEDRRIALIVAIHSREKDDFRLYLTSEEILQPKHTYACSGIGEILGGYFLERLYDPALHLEEAETLMAFIAKEAKDSVGQVGRETEFVTLRKISGQLGRTWHSRATDRDIPHLLTCLNPFWKRKISARPHTTDATNPKAAK
jgi:20S proteasome alpha/beta subunit